MKDLIIGLNGTYATGVVYSGQNPEPRSIVA